MRREPYRPSMFQVRAVSTHFLMVGAVQACTRSSRLAAFGATSTISRFSARRSAVRRPCRESLQKRCHWRPPACITLSPPSRHSSAASHCLQPEDNKRRRGLVQRSTRLIKNEKNAHDHHLRQPAHRKKIGTQSENRPARRWIDSGVIT